MNYLVNRLHKYPISKEAKKKKRTKHYNEHTLYNNKYITNNTIYKTPNPTKTTYRHRPTTPESEMGPLHIH
jgi:hypothetical protein